MHSQKTIVSALLLTATASIAQADPGMNFTDRAQVVSSTPVYQQINEPHRECWTETVGGEYRNENRSYGGAIVGGLIGGLLGNTVGKGNGRTAATAVGAVTGAMVGDNISNRDNYGYQPRQVERCRVQDNYRQVVSGYNVVYRYRGRDFTTTLPYDPGNTLDLNVSATVAQNQGNY
ncbi:MAG: glycine zipper 2TM domain-containing protein [Sulfuriferula sp.]